MKYVLASLFLLAVLTSPALAGGNNGGTKNNNGILRIQNTTNQNQNGGQRLAVIVNAPAGFTPVGLTLTQFQNLGGRILDPGETTSYTNRAGNQRIQAAFLLQVGGTTTIGVPGTANVSLSRNEHVRVNVNGNAGAGPSFVIIRNSD